MTKHELEARAAELESEVKRNRARLVWQFNMDAMEEIGNFPLSILEYELEWIATQYDTLKTWVFDESQGVKEQRDVKRKQFETLAKYKSQLEGALIILRQYAESEQPSLFNQAQAA